jgi:DUF2971 family protein
MRVYHYLKAKWALDDIKRRRLKLSKIDDMNDPWEWKSVCSDDEQTQWALSSTEQQVIEDWSAACFGRSWKNILMWSHYGDRHKGICLGFDVPDELIKEVNYVESLEVIGALTDFETDERTNEGIRILDKLFSAKYARWCYEEEIRVIGSRKEKDEETRHYFLDFGENLKLKEVIAAVRCPISKAAIEDALQGYSEEVKIIKAGMAHDKFEIVIDERGFDPPSVPKTSPHST